MTSGRLPRRLVVGATSGALLLGIVGFVPLLTSASAAGCPTWTDPKGDSIASLEGMADPTGFFTDANLDVVASTFGTVGDSLVATISTDALNANSSDTGDEFGFDFTVAGVALNLYADRTVLEGTSILDDAGVLGPNASGAATATYDIAKKTVTIKAKLTEVALAAEKPVAGQAVSALSSYTKDQVPLVPLGFGQPVLEYDRSATTLTTVLGTECAVGVTPTATGTASPAPTGSATPSPTASPSPTTTTPPTTGGLFDQPRKNCATFKDPTGDADPTGTGIDNEPALDITQVNLKSPAGSLQVFVKVTDPSAALLDIFDGPVYSATFTVGGKTVAVSAPGTGPATATVGTAANTDIKATAKVDSTNKNVVFTIPLDGLSKAVGSTVKAGTPITATKADTAADSLLGEQPADTATGTAAAEKTYAYGDNTCFKPLPGVFEIDADPSGQYTDITVVFATLKDGDGSPVPGAKVTGLLSGARPITVITDSDGIAELRLPLLVPAARRVITVSFLGNAEVGPAKVAKAFTVLAEKTLLRAVPIRGGASATVVDNDKRAVVGRYVRFVVGSKSFLRKTNTRGVAVLTGVRTGTAIRVTFLPVRNYYLGSPTYTVKAR